MNSFRTFTVAAITSLATLAATLCASGSASAQTMIDQQKALAGNLTTGDEPGFPISITQAGTYRLTGNLKVPAGVDGIRVLASGVTIDLNGFTISAPGLCIQEPVSRTLSCSGSHHGIDSRVAGVSAPLGVTVRNGTVRGFKEGVFLASGRVQDMTLTHNDRAVYIEGGSTGGEVTRTTVTYNNIGVHGNGVVIRDSVAASNSLGFSGNGSSTLIDSMAYDNHTGVAQLGVHGVRAFVNRKDFEMVTRF